MLLGALVVLLICWFWMLVLLFGCFAFVLLVSWLLAVLECLFEVGCVRLAWCLGLV